VLERDQVVFPRRLDALGAHELEQHSEVVEHRARLVGRDHLIAEAFLVGLGALAQHQGLLLPAAMGVWRPSLAGRS
jgi:hypothetical protein